MAKLLYGSGLRSMERVRLRVKNDLERGYGQVYLPYALESKYPNAGREWDWQYVFPSHRLSKNPRTSESIAIMW